MNHRCWQSFPCKVIHHIRTTVLWWIVDFEMKKMWYFVLIIIELYNCWSMIVIISLNNHDNDYMLCCWNYFGKWPGKSKLLYSITDKLQSWRKLCLGIHTWIPKLMCKTIILLWCGRWLSYLRTIAGRVDHIEILLKENLLIRLRSQDRFRFQHFQIATTPETG